MLRRGLKGDRGPRQRSILLPAPNAVTGIILFALVALWRNWLLAPRVVNQNELEVDGQVFPAAEVAEADFLGLPLEGIHEVDRNQAAGSTPVSATLSGLGEDDLSDLDPDAFDDREDNGEEDNDEEELLDDSARASVLLTKESIRRLEIRERSAAAFKKKQNLFLHDEASIAMAREHLSAAAGHPGRRSANKIRATQPVKDKYIERHFLKGHWFIPGEKYFVYQPSGGMSNQRIILEHALIVARTLGRTLVVPPVGPHTSMFWNYNKVTWERTVEAFQVFEKERMSAATPVLGLSNTILRRFVEFNENKHNQLWLRVQRDRKGSARGRLWTTSDIRALYGNVTEDVLFFAQSTMWKSFDFTEAELDFAHNHVQLESSFRQIARVARTTLFGDRPYLAAHVRFEDKFTQIYSDQLSPAGVFIRRLARSWVQNITSEMYIATQPSKISSPYFEPFRSAGYSLTFSDKLMDIPEVLQFLDQFPKNDIQSSVLGLVEQLICARAERFVGTGFSTFSQYIRIKRSDKILVYDESLLPEIYRHDPAFLARCRVGSAIRAMRKAAPSQVAQSEIALLGREDLCDTGPVSLRVC